MLVPGQITQWLKRLREGDEAALEHLVPLLYDELRQLARWQLRNNKTDRSCRAPKMFRALLLWRDMLD